MSPVGGRRAERALAVLAWAGLAACFATVVAPMWRGMDRWGGHDWDAALAFRQIVVTSLRDHHQFPFWNPWAGGGYTAWGFVESDTIVVSPWLPLYFLFDLRVAARLEVVGALCISAVGTWALASRFTKSVAGRAFACAVFVANGRWALQATAGHVWHLYYAWMPWALFFFDRAVSRETHARAQRDVVLGGVCVAMLVYSGAVYPLPHTVVAVGLYGALLAASYRSVAPLLRGAAMGLVGLGLAAPRLVPLLDAFRSAPRLVESTESMDLRVFTETLTARAQGFGAHPASPTQWGWHEWGMYIGFVPMALLAVAALQARGARESAARWVGVAFFLLGFGNFHDRSPWHLLHQAPVFRSLHVPSRWMYPAALLFALVAAGMIGRVVARAGRHRLLADAAMLACVLWLGADIARVAAQPMGSAFWMELSPAVVRSPEFHQEQAATPATSYRDGDWSVPLLPAVLANVGVITSTAVAPVGIYSKDATGRIPGQGAKGRGDAAYRGEAFFVDSPAAAKLARFSPNEMVVEVDERARKGDLLVLDQNFDPGWRADGAPVENHADTVAVRLARPGAARVTFRYRPRSLGLGLALFAATLAALALLARRARAAARGTLSECAASSV